MRYLRFPNAVTGYPIPRPEPTFPFPVDAAPADTIVIVDLARSESRPEADVRQVLRFGHRISITICARSDGQARSI